MRIPFRREQSAGGTPPPPSPSGRTVERAWREAALAEAQLDAQLSRLCESSIGRLQTDLAVDDRGWTRVGSNTTAEPTIAELSEWRDICRKLWVIDPTVARMQGLLQSGALGAEVGTPRAAHPMVQRIVDALWEDVDNSLALFSHEGLCDLSLALVVEGERFLGLHTAPGDDMVKLSIIPVDDIAVVVSYPENAKRPLLYRREFRESRFNFETGAYELSSDKVVWHYRDWRAPDPENPQEDDDQDALAMIEAAPNLQRDVCIYHVKVNTMWSRGIPILYRSLDWAKAYSRQLRDMAVLTAAQAAFAWKKKMKTSSAAAIAAGAAQFREDAPGPGAVYTSNEAVSLDPVNIGTGANTNQGVTAKHLHLQTIRQLGFGSHWYGDVDQGTLATAASTETPAIWSIGEHQAVLSRPVIDILQWAVKRVQTSKRSAREAAYLPLVRLDLSLDLNLPPAKPTNDAVLGPTLTAILGAMTAGHLDIEEGEYQILQRVGATNIAEIMEKRREEREEAENQAEEEKRNAPTEPPPPGSPAEPPEEQAAADAAAVAPAVGAAKEADTALPDAEPSEEQLALEAAYAAAFDREVLAPWQKRVKRWLESLRAMPSAGKLRTMIAASAAPDSAAIDKVLRGLMLDAANLGGKEGLLKVAESYRTLLGAQTTEAVREADDRGRVKKRRTEPDGGRTVIYEDGTVERWEPNGARETLQERLGRQGEWNDLMDPKKSETVAQTFNLRDPKLLTKLAAAGTEIRGVVTETMLDDLHGVLSAQFAEGLSPADVAADIESIFPLTYADRGQNIAQTEVHSARGLVQHEVLERCGPQRHQWLSSMDLKVRDAHRTAHGQVKRIGEAFEVGGTQMMHPGDPAGGAANVCRCRCDEVIVVGEDDDLPPAPWLGE